ncbi:MAG: DUF58 domain-containing protein [Pseudomonadota bacterium]
MRPSRHLLTIGAVWLALTVLVIVVNMPPALVLVAWAGFAVFAFFDLVTSPQRHALNLRVDAPGDVFCGETARLPVHISARDTLPDFTEARAEVAQDLGGQTRFTLTPVTPVTATGEIRLPVTKRGTFDVSGIWLRWMSRYKLWELTPRFSVAHSINVVPNIRPVTSGQIEATVRSELYGIKDTSTRGEGSEFHQLVEFTAGMDHRSIDWKRSAQHRSLVAKETRAERNHQIILALDNGYLMRGQIDGLSRIDHAINAALTVAWAAGLGGDLVGLFSFDAEPRHYSPPQPARASFPMLRRQMGRMEYTSVESNHTLAMAHLNGRLKRRSMIVVFSDFADPTTAELLVENLEVLSRAHLVVFATLSDPALDRRQSGSARSADDVAEAVVAADMLRDRQLVFDRLQRIGVLCVETAPGKLSPGLLTTYLDIKARELI